MQRACDVALQARCALRVRFRVKTALLIHQQPTRSLLPPQHVRQRSLRANSLIHMGGRLGTPFAYMHCAVNALRLPN